MGGWIIRTSRREPAQSVDPRLLVRLFALLTAGEALQALA